MLNEGAREHPASNMAAAQQTTIAGIRIISVVMDFRSLITLWHLGVKKIACLKS